MGRSRVVSNRITLVWPDSTHFYRGMAVRVGDQVFRIKSVDLASLVVDRPLWWRVARWLRAVLRG
jgi:hypothetical protein